LSKGDERLKGCWEGESTKGEACKGFEGGEDRVLHGVRHLLSSDQDSKEAGSLAAGSCFKAPMQGTIKR